MPTQTLKLNKQTKDMGIIINRTFQMFGFLNFKDFKTSFLGAWYREVLFFTTLIINGIYFGMASVLGHINSIWYKPASAILFTMVIIIIDWAVAVYGATIRNEFSTTKAQRIIPMIIVNWLLLSAFYNLVKYLITPLEIVILTQTAYFFVKMSAMYLGAVHFISALKNASKANLVDNEWVSFIMKKVDKHKDKLDDII